MQVIEGDLTDTAAVEAAIDAGVKAASCSLPGMLPGYPIPRVVDRVTPWLKTRGSPQRLH